MSCCGQKRAEWAAERRRPQPSHAAEAEPIAPARNRAPRSFAYVGDSGASLVLTGAATGTTYRFPEPGLAVEVAYEDTFAMLAEPSLRVLPRG